MKRKINLSITVSEDNDHQLGVTLQELNEHLGTFTKTLDMFDNITYDYESDDFVLCCSCDEFKPYNDLSFDKLLETDQDKVMIYASNLKEGVFKLIDVKQFENKRICSDCEDKIFE